MIVFKIYSFVLIFFMTIGHIVNILNPAKKIEGNKKQTELDVIKTSTIALLVGVIPLLIALLAN